jgi:ribonuclease E
MAEKMLIDASHAEETRVVVVRGNRIEEFDFESEHKKQIRGNIYLAKVTRVEPSLQAAFVDYGGNRHGFLAFAEIHPDYYQIPLADRQALLRAEAEEHRRDDEIEQIETGTDLSDDSEPTVEAVATAVEEAPAVDAAPEAEAEVVEAAAALAEEAPAEKPKKPRRTRKAKAKTEDAPAAEEAAAPAETSDDETPGGAMAMAVDTDEISEPSERKRGRRRRDDDDDDDDHHGEEKEVIESVGAEDAMEEVPDRVSRKPRKQYRIQEVIKRRQILLDAGRQGRARQQGCSAHHLSVARRPLRGSHAEHGAWRRHFSRKITSAQDRNRLKEVVQDLDVPEGMGVILRTAGAARTQPEIKRDFEYLLRMWEQVRDLTLRSSAPSLVYEEGSLIKRSIRDLFNKEIDEVIVAGDNGYQEAQRLHEDADAERDTGREALSRRPAAVLAHGRRASA